MLQRILVSYAVCIFMMSVAAAANAPVNNPIPANTPSTPNTPPAHACNQPNNHDDADSTPAGTYTTNNRDGSTNTVYTTGEKKPYYVDNGCNNTSQPEIQPYVAIQPPTGASPSATAPAPVIRAQN